MTDHGNRAGESADQKVAVLPGWWLSWYNVLDLNTFELHSPWWVSGYRSAVDDDGEFVDHETMVAAVRAVDEAAAWDMIRLSYDDPPEGVGRRFIESLAEGESPFSERFPQRDWMEWDAEGHTCRCPAMHAPDAVQHPGSRDADGAR